MKVKYFIEMLKPCAPDAELGSVDIYRTDDGEEAVDVIYKREIDDSEKLIKTENAARFIADYFINPDGRRGNVDIEYIVESETKDEVLISKKSGLNESDTLVIHHKQKYNNRCSVDEQLIYKLEEHDSVSLKGVLSHYSPRAIITK